MKEELRHELVRLTYSPEIVSFELTRQQGLEILKEIERLNNIINELEKYLDNLHWFRLGKKEENGNMEYFYASVSNFYEDTKNILKGSEKE